MLLSRRRVHIRPPPTARGRTTRWWRRVLGARRQRYATHSAKSTLELGGHARELAAGDVQHRAVDEVRPRRAEEEHAAGRLLGRARAAERDQHRGHAAHLVGDAELALLAADLHRVVLDLGGGEAGLDPAERDRVDVDLELAPFLGERLGEADDA